MPWARPRSRYPTLVRIRQGATSPFPPDLFRLSVGIEHPRNLPAELEPVLAIAG